MVLGSSLVAVMLAAGPAVVAFAADYTVGGDMPYNQTTWYGTARPHAGGASAYRLDSYSPQFCGGAFQIALRDTRSLDSSHFSTWTSVGGTKNFTWHTGGNLPASNYTVTAKNYGAGCDPHTVYWSGLLRLG